MTFVERAFGVAAFIVVLVLGTGWVRGSLDVLAGTQMLVVLAVALGCGVVSAAALAYVTRLADDHD